MIKSVGYPVMVDLGNDAGAMYSVYVDNELVFSGRSIERNIDLAPLLRDYLNSERIIIDRPEGEGIANATAQTNAGMVKAFVIPSSEEVKIYVAASDTMPPLSSLPDLTGVPTGYNFRGKTVVFTNTDKPMTDRGIFDREDWIGGTMPGVSGGRWALASTFDGGGGGEDEIYVGASNGALSTSLWFVGIGWLQTSFTFPDDQDYVVDANSFRPHVGDSWGWDYAVIIDTAPILIANDYNEDCKTDFPSTPSITSEFIRNEIDRRQIAFLGANSGLSSMVFNTTCKGRDNSITLDKITPGTNLRGKTITFTNTDKYVPDPNPSDDPEFVGFVIRANTNEDGSPDWALAIGRFDAAWAILVSSGEGGFAIVFMHDPDDPDTNQLWLEMSITIPDDKDYIVDYNDLPAHAGDDWGFDYAKIGEEGQSESTSETYGGPSTIVRTTIDLPDADSLSFAVADTAGAVFDSLNLKITPCGKYRYALYAVNRRGGITHIVCEGKPLESYQKTNWDIDTDYNRLSEIGRGTRRMSVTSTRRWKLNTGYLTESEAKHIDDIVTSPRVVLHDLQEGRLFAVNSNDSTIERRTRASNGRKPIEYTLTFEEARIEIRR